MAGRAVTGLELELAIALCGYRCAECGSDEVVLRDVPVIRHWRNADGWWCPALGGGPAAARESLDFLEALARVMLVADYGEPVDHEFAAAAALWERAGTRRTGSPLTSTA